MGEHYNLWFLLVINWEFELSINEKSSRATNEKLIWVFDWLNNPQSELSTHGNRAFDWCKNSECLPLSEIQILLFVLYIDNKYW